MPPYRPLAERYADKVVRADTGCLLWQAAIDGYGYGIIRSERSGPLKRAHIVAWYLHYGVWPTDCLLHTCDTPGCSEVTHLREGSRADNNADRDAKGRHWALSGERHNMAKLSLRQVGEIRRRLAGAGRGMARQLAWEYGVSESCVGRVRAGRTWSGENDSQFGR